MVRLVKIVRSAKPEKKYDAHFITDANRKKVVSFGSAGMDDYTKTKDKEQQQRYLARHHKHEDWASPMTAGALSRYVLWSSTTLAGGIANYRARFGL